MKVSCLRTAGKISDRMHEKKADAPLNNLLAGRTSSQPTAAPAPAGANTGVQARRRVRQARLASRRVNRPPLRRRLGLLDRLPLRSSGRRPS